MRPFTLYERRALFLVGCIGTRLSFVYLAYVASLTTLRIMAVLAAVLALGFATLYLFGLRTHGIETGGQPIWWNALRPFHALMYGAFAYLAWTGQQSLAWKVLLADVVVGLDAFLWHHRQHKNTK